MRVRVFNIGMTLAVFVGPLSVSGQSADYRWLREVNSADCLAARIPPPAGYLRKTATPGTFAHWLQHLPLKPGDPPVHLYDGREKANQTAHRAVFDIDIGFKNLQQCADAIIRLRAEYLWAAGRYADIHFNFTSGDTAWYHEWLAGMRPQVNGNSVVWHKVTAVDSSYENFRSYLETVFTYAGSYSLNRELLPLEHLGELDIGDIFIEGGFPGHAVIVVDVAVNLATGKKVFLLAQSYSPAQDIHLLKNPADPELSPWYDPDCGAWLRTPEWRFSRKDLKRFRRTTTVEAGSTTIR